MSCSGLRNLIGSYTTKVIMTACVFDGARWEINNCYDTAIHVGGSDCFFFMSGALLDSGTAFNVSGSATGHPHLWFDYIEKAHVGPIYMTTEGPWGGILVSGPAYNTGTPSNLGGPVKFYGGIWEGRNAGAPCDGSVFRQDGGIVAIRDVWVGYGMNSPASQGHSPQDAGMMHVRGSGRMVLDGVTYDRATGLAETVPCVYYESGSKVRVSNAFVGWKGGTWSGLPRLDEPSAGDSTTGGGAVDSSFTVI
jgi:hypothetical protein